MAVHKPRGATFYIPNLSVLLFVTLFLIIITTTATILIIAIIILLET